MCGFSFLQLLLTAEEADYFPYCKSMTQIIDVDEDVVSFLFLIMMQITVIRLWKSVFHLLALYIVSGVKERKRKCNQRVLCKL